MRNKNKFRFEWNRIEAKRNEKFDAKWSENKFLFEWNSTEAKRNKKFDVKQSENKFWLEQNNAEAKQNKIWSETALKAKWNEKLEAKWSEKFFLGFAKKKRSKAKQFLFRFVSLRSEKKNKRKWDTLVAITASSSYYVAITASS